MGKCRDWFSNLWGKKVEIPGMQQRPEGSGDCWVPERWRQGTSGKGRKQEGLKRAEWPSDHPVPEVRAEPCGCHDHVFPSFTLWPFVMSVANGDVTESIYTVSVCSRLSCLRESKWVFHLLMELGRTYFIYPTLPEIPSYCPAGWYGNPDILDYLLGAIFILLCLSVFKDSILNIKARCQVRTQD